jgi:hypothetical protein
MPVFKVVKKADKDQSNLAIDKPSDEQKKDEKAAGPKKQASKKLLNYDSDDA